MRKGFFPALLLALAATAACGNETPVSRLETPPAAAVSSPTESGVQLPVIVAFGDSLTAGHGVAASASYPAQLQRRLNELGYRYRVINAGISGETSSQGIARVESVLSHRPELTIVEFGANDGLRGVPVAATRRNLVEIVKRLRQGGSQVVIAGMLLPPNYGPRYIEDFRSMFADVAREHGAQLIPFFLDGVAGRDDLNIDDGIHPNEKGNEVIADNVLKAIRPYLR